MPSEKQVPGEAISSARACCSSAATTARAPLRVALRLHPWTFIPTPPRNRGS